MRQLAILPFILITLVGCESDFQRCMNTELPRAQASIERSYTDLDESAEDLEIWVAQVEDWIEKFNPLIAWIDANPGPIDTRTVAGLDSQDENVLKFLAHRVAFLTYWGQINKASGNPITAPVDLLNYSFQITEEFFDKFTHLENEAIFDGEDIFDKLINDDVLLNSGSEIASLKLFSEMLSNARQLLDTTKQSRARAVSEALVLASNTCNEHGLYD